MNAENKSLKWHLARWIGFVLVALISIIKMISVYNSNVLLRGVCRSCILPKDWRRRNQNAIDISKQTDSWRRWESSGGALAIVGVTPPLVTLYGNRTIGPKISMGCVVANSMKERRVWSCPICCCTVRKAFTSGWRVFRSRLWHKYRRRLCDRRLRNYRDARIV